MSERKRRLGWRPSHWSDEDDQRLVKIWTADMPVVEIAKLFGRSETAVAQRAKTLRKRGCPIGKRPIIYRPPVLTWERATQRVGALQVGMVFRDDPRAVRAPCEPFRLCAPSTPVLQGSSAANAVRG